MLLNLPLWARKGAVDFITSGVAALVALEFTLPGSVSDISRVLLIVGASVLGALVSAGRRAAPAAGVWLAAKFGADAQ